MSKKTFKNKHALQFISVPDETDQQENEAPEHLIENKKSIKVAVPMKPNPLYIETRSKRLQLLIQPSLYDKLKTIAIVKGISINELIHNALDEYMDNKLY